MNLHKINFVKQAIYALAVPLWWVCLSAYLSTTYDCRIGIVGLSGMSCTQGSSSTLLSVVLLGLPIAVIAILYSLVALILSFTLPYEHNEDDDGPRPNRWLTITKHLMLWVAPIIIAVFATAPKPKISEETLSEQKKIDAVSGAWTCKAECNAAFPAGDFFSISRHLDGALQLVGTADGKLRSVNDIWPSRNIENNYTIELSNTSPPTVINAVFNPQEKTLRIENGKVLVQDPTIKLLNKPSK
jgi:hypothetical protein